MQSPLFYSQRTAAPIVVLFVSKDLDETPEYFYSLQRAESYSRNLSPYYVQRSCPGVDTGITPSRYYRPGSTNLHPLSQDVPSFDRVDPDAFLQNDELLRPFSIGTPMLII